MKSVNRNGRCRARRAGFRAEFLEGRTLLSGIYYINDPAVAEGDPPNTTTLTFRVDWVGSFQSEPGAVIVTTSDGTASAAEGDYAHRTTVLAFPAFGGEPRFRNFTVTVTGDSRDEANETVVATLSSPGPVGIVDPTGVGTIVEDDDHRPTAHFQPVSPNPRASPVASVAIGFSEDVGNVDVSDFTLTRDGGINLLTPAQTVATADDRTFVLGNLAGLTSVPGASYELRLRDDPGSTLIADFYNNALEFGAVTSWSTLPDDGDPDDQISEAMPASNGPVEAALARGDNVDMYKVVAAAGDAARFDVRSNAGFLEVVLFPQLRLFNAAGTELATDPASVNYTFPAAGTYYVGVSEAGNPYDPTTGVDPVSTRAGGKYLLTIAGLTREIGPVGPEFRVNTYTPSLQAFPATAMDADGDFVVAWQSKGQDGPIPTAEGVYAQRFSAAGSPQGGEFLVNTTTLGNQFRPQVAMDDLGNFVIAWQGEDADGAGIYARRYSAAGAALSGEFHVNTHTPQFQTNPTIAMDSDGDFVVAWHSQNQVGATSLNDVFAQRYSKTGAAAGGEFRVSTATNNQQWFPTAAMDDAGNFVIAWESIFQDPGTSTGIYAQRYDAAGAAQGAEFRINAYTLSDQNLPTAAMDADGDFVVAWHGYAPGDGNGVYARRFSAAGAAQGGDFQVNTAEHSFQRHTAVAMDADGDFVVSWQNEYGDANLGRTSVDAQRYGAGGNRVGAEFRVNTTTLGNHRHPAAAMDADGDFVVAWAGYGQDPGDTANDSGIYAQRYGAPQAASIAAVYVRGTAWGNAANVSFGQYLEANGLGDDVLGFRVDGLAATATLPWTNLNEIVLRYSGPVTGSGIPREGDVVLDGVRGDYRVQAVAQPDPQTLLLTLDRVLGGQGAAGGDGDRVRLTVPGAAAGGGAYGLTLNTLAGDADRNNGRVNANDVGTVRSRQNRSAAEAPPAGLAPYSPFADLDATGRINANDLGSVRARANDALPAAPASAAPFSSGPTIGPAPADLGSVTEDLLRARAVML